MRKEISFLCPLPHSRITSFVIQSPNDRMKYKLITVAVRGLIKLGKKVASLRWISLVIEYIFLLFSLCIKISLPPKEWSLTKLGLISFHFADSCQCVTKYIFEVSILFLFLLFSSNKTLSPPATTNRCFVCIFAFLIFSVFVNKNIYQTCHAIEIVVVLCALYS